jgi:hypothetical protein
VETRRDEGHETIAKDALQVRGHAIEPLTCANREIEAAGHRSIVVCAAYEGRGC